MANRCDIYIKVLGDKDGLSELENLFAEAFGGHRDFPFLEIVDTEDGRSYLTSYAWSPPIEKLEPIFASHPHFTFLVECWEMMGGWRGASVFAAETRET